MSGDIPARRHAAVRDWETSGDAMRWNPDRADAPCWPDPGSEGAPLALRWPDELSAQDSLADFARRLGEAVRQASPVFAEMHVTFERAAESLGAFGSCVSGVQPPGGLLPTT